jgi:hypothetical protein
MIYVRLVLNSVKNGMFWIGSSSEVEKSQCRHGQYLDFCKSLLSALQKSHTAKLLSDELLNIYLHPQPSEANANQAVYAEVARETPVDDTETTLIAAFGLKEYQCE